MSFATECAENMETLYGNMFGNMFYYAHKGGKDAEKIRKAEDAYASMWMDDEEELVLVCDATIFGSADEGVALSTKHVFYKNDITGLNLSFGYDEISDVRGDFERVILQMKDGSEMYIAEGYRDEARVCLRFAIQYMKSTIESKPFLDEWEQDLKEVLFEEQVPEAEDVSQEALAAPAESVSTCTNCGATLMPNAKFCSECGAPVTKTEPERPTHCPICGTELAEHAKFCSECGYKIEG